MFRGALRFRLADHQQCFLQLWTGHDLNPLFVGQQPQAQVEVVL